METQKLRKQLHRYPELSGAEKNTAAFIAGELYRIGVKNVHQGFSEFSVLAEIDSGKPGKTILFRAELDALPIEEINLFEHKSTIKGISHKCGHDGHIIILLDLARKFMEAQFPGKILLLFQSSEENGNGAKSILNSGKLEDFTIDYIFALHNIPGYPVGSVICKAGEFTPSVVSLDIHLFGKTSHAGMPEKGINPAACVAEIIQHFQEIHHPATREKQYFLSTPIQINLGRPAYGISAGNAVVSYTFRTWEKDFLELKKEEIKSALKKIVGKTKGLQYLLDWKLAFDANINEETAYDYIKNASAENNLIFIEKEEPFSFGEDFGYFTQNYKGAMFGLGAGEETPELHNPDYDFPDEIHETGVKMFFSIAKSILV